MNWVVDTCLVIDVLDGDPAFGLSSARLIDKLSKDGLSLCPLSYVELAPSFLGDRRRQNEFLDALRIDYRDAWDDRATAQAHQAWNRFVELRRARRAGKRPVADIMIGAFAAVRRGLLTRNAADFQDVYPELKIVVPQ